jgi:flagella basal body P-ring formation protein FlgA
LLLHWIATYGEIMNIISCSDRLLRALGCTLSALAAGLACCVPLLASAKSIQDLRQIEEVVASFAAARSRDLPGRVSVNVGTVDPRVTLTQCESLEAFLPAGTRLWGTANVGVRCKTPVSWTLYVPVHVHIAANVLVAARPLERGRLLTQDDFVIQERDLTLLPAGVQTDPGAVIGKVLLNPLAGGMPVRAELLRGEYLVTQGQPVKLVYQLNGLIVTSEGKSLGNAGRSDAVNVRSYGGQIKRGVVVSAGVVEVM